MEYVRSICLQNNQINASLTASLEYRYSPQVSISSCTKRSFTFHFLPCSNLQNEGRVQVFGRQRNSQQPIKCRDSPYASVRTHSEDTASVLKLPEKPDSWVLATLYAVVVSVDP
ncbi:Bgt-20426 [Blumeria graminis f. sp. tritici]|uniref:Bgt-20426 n=2 Tax=Blumeria graminis f. sp. tritici TaxID=62690 RepID=A0A9X9MI72_BLUGR|nr:Bgt-20426 [Blumeria graminis f. sp. tritici]